ncbi:alpha/beta hydrolase family protein [Corynebacterium durum]|jgi:hypothetical protein
MRINFELTPSGTHYCFLEATFSSELPNIGYGKIVEDPREAQKIVVPRIFGIPTHLAPLDAGLIVFAAAVEQGVFKLNLLNTSLQTIETIGQVHGQKLRLHYQLAEQGIICIVALGADGTGSIFVLELPSKTLRYVTSVTNVQLLGGGLLNSHTLLLNRGKDNTFHIKPILLNLSNGQVHDRIPLIPENSNCINVSLVKQRGCIGVQNNDGDYHYYIYRDNQNHQRLRIPDKYIETYSQFRVMDATPDLTLILLHERRGVVSLFYILNFKTGLVEPLPVPLGSVAGACKIRKRTNLITVSITLKTPFSDGKIYNFDVSQKARNDASGVATQPIPECTDEEVTVSSKWAVIGKRSRNFIEWRPEKRNGKIVVSLHGGPYDSWKPCSHWFHEYLARNGYLVIAPNVIGSSDFGEDCANGIREKWGIADALEIKELISLLKSTSNYSELILHGESYGAFLALCVANICDDISRVVAIAPFSSVTTLYAAATEEVRKMMVRRGGVTPCGAPPLQIVDLAKQVNWSQKDCLLVYAQDDPVIPASEFSRIQSSAEQKSHVLLLETGGHRPDIGPEAEKIQGEIMNFISPG